MSGLSLALWGLGVVLIAIGYLRARRPWAQYRRLKEEDANVTRYERWRGGTRDTGATGASVAMEVLRRQARIGGLVAVAGFALVFLGFLIR